MERFWDKTEPEPNSGCWLWTGALKPEGYGTFNFQKKWYRAHRLAWELEIGPIPDGLCVLHKCDVPSCVNPDHLFLGTKADNTADMCRKGRHVGNRKLTWEQVAEIRASSEPQQSLADRFGVSQPAVSAVRTGRSWVQEAQK